MKIYNEVDFNNKITELQNAAGNKNVWIRDDLSVRKKSNRFVRILSLLLSMIGIDCYRHYRVHNVAKDVFLFAQTNQEHLTVDNAQLLMKTLDWMKQRTGKKYENTVEIIKSAIYGILYNKGLTKPADDPAAAPADAAAQPAQNPPPLLPHPAAAPADTAAQPAQNPPPPLPPQVAAPADVAAQPAQIPPPPLPPRRAARPQPQAQPDQAAPAAAPRVRFGRDAVPRLLPRPVAPPADAAAQPDQAAPAARRPLPPIPVDADGLNAARANLQAPAAPEPQPQALTPAQLQAQQLRPAAARVLPPRPAEADPASIFDGALNARVHLLPTDSIVIDNPHTAGVNNEPGAFATYRPEELERALELAELQRRQEEERKAREAELIAANRREFAARATQSEPNLHIVRAATPVDLNGGLDQIAAALLTARSPSPQQRQIPSPEPVSPMFAANAITARRQAFDSVIDFDGGWSTADGLPLPQVSDSDEDQSSVNGAVDGLPFPDPEI